MLSISVRNSLIPCSDSEDRTFAANAAPSPKDPCLCHGTTEENDLAKLVSCLLYLSLEDGRIRFYNKRREVKIYLVYSSETTSA
jgi:hypothetical protein